MGELADAVRIRIRMDSDSAIADCWQLLDRISALEQRASDAEQPVSIPQPIYVVGDPYWTANRDAEAEIARQQFATDLDLSARLAAAEARAERAERRAGIRVMSMDASPERVAQAAIEEERANAAAFTVVSDLVQRRGRVAHVSAIATAGFTNSWDCAGVEINAINHGGRPLIVVLLEPTSDADADHLEHRGSSLIEAGEKLLQEYEKRKAAADAASAEVMR